MNLWIFGVKEEKVSDWNCNRHIFTEIESTVNNITVLCHYRTFIDDQNFRSKSYGTIPRQGKNFKKVFALSYEIICLSVLVDESSFRLEISLCKLIDLMRKSFQNLNNQYRLNFFILFLSSQWRVLKTTFKKNDSFLVADKSLISIYSICVHSNFDLL